MSDFKYDLTDRLEDFAADTFKLYDKNLSPTPEITWQSNKYVLPVLQP